MSRRLPAEWEPHAGTWLAWPHNRSTWPSIYERIPAAYAALVRAVRRFEPVHLLVPDLSAAAAIESRDDLGGPHGLRLHVVPTNDAWIRDFGPLFVDDDGELVATSWRFDSWGGKYPFERDAAAGREVARRSGRPVRTIDAVLEGGSIDSNGAGTVLTTEGCLLARHAALGKAGVEELLGRELGVRRVLWLGDGIVGDDTDGHVDDVTRFVSPSTVVTAVEDDPADANYTPLRENRERLEALRTADEHPLRVVELPMPRPVVQDGLRLPASYANFLVVNDAVIVPTFGCDRDADALAVLGREFPGRAIVGVDTRDLVLGLGGVHCLSCHQPAGVPFDQPATRSASSRSPRPSAAPDASIVPLHSRPVSLHSARNPPEKERSTDERPTDHDQ